MIIIITLVITLTTTIKHYDNDNNYIINNAIDNANESKIMIIKKRMKQ